MPVSILEFGRQDIVVEYPVPEGPAVLECSGLYCIFISSINVGWESDSSVRSDPTLFNLLIIFGIELENVHHQTFLITLHVSPDFVGKDKL